MSLRRTSVFVSFMGRAFLPLMVLGAALPAQAQYPGQITKPDKSAPELRSVAVLEWTGEAGKPKASRLVPVTVLDGGSLQDGGIYMARPEPLALAGEVEYELENDGKSVGLFDIENSGREQGSWVGYGAWKSMPVAKPKSVAPPKIEDEAPGDEPVLHRKHHADDKPSSGNGSGSAGSDSSAAPAPDADPDRPTLHKKDSGNSTSDAGSSGASSTADPDQPTLHRHDSTDSSASGSASSSASSADPDRPVMKKSKKKPEDVGHVDSMPDATDPDRPRLKRGNTDGYKLNVVPSLMGIPPDMQQAVAVSDAKTRPEHPWAYTWSNPGDEVKMKSALEEIARTALGLATPAPPPAPKKTTATKTPMHKTAKPTPPPLPAPLEDEKFRVFELSYGSGATMVLQAHTSGPLAQQKFVTLVAQPDLYGNALILLKSVTDGAHLDETPRMRLVDAVDVMADNRGELLFELRGATQRQFALYRVLRGQAEKLFVSGGGEFGTESE
jgi:hypothetical protein